ncbi:hypothetical protein VP01_34g1 [Puccinia sorghi]|uniref:Uncharacterized protein n=1 Tax=Puccinia sorghi TaxID=27349 RepID=A0A0L6UWH6_9BASI|nr:hypothetical protein VP01_34g1 [Puccinia sorghi]
MLFRVTFLRCSHFLSHLGVFFFTSSWKFRCPYTRTLSHLCFHWLYSFILPLALLSELGYPPPCVGVRTGVFESCCRPALHFFFLFFASTCDSSNIMAWAMLARFTWGPHNMIRLQPIWLGDLADMLDHIRLLSGRSDHGLSPPASQFGWETLLRYNFRRAKFIYSIQNSDIKSSRKFSPRVLSQCMKLFVCELAWTPLLEPINIKFFFFLVLILSSDLRTCKKQDRCVYICWPDQNDHKICTRRKKRKSGVMDYIQLSKKRVFGMASHFLTCGLPWQLLSTHHHMYLCPLLSNQHTTQKKQKLLHIPPPLHFLHIPKSLSPRNFSSIDSNPMAEFQQLMHSTAPINIFSLIQNNMYIKRKTKTRSFEKRIIKNKDLGKSTNLDCMSLHASVNVHVIDMCGGLMIFTVGGQRGCVNSDPRGLRGCCPRICDFCPVVLEIGKKIEKEKNKRIKEILTTATDQQMLCGFTGCATLEDCLDWQVMLQAAESAVSNTTTMRQLHLTPFTFKLFISSLFQSLFTFPIPTHHGHLRIAADRSVSWGMRGDSQPVRPALCIAAVEPDRLCSMSYLKLCRFQTNQISHFKYLPRSPPVIFANVLNAFLTLCRILRDNLSPENTSIPEILPNIVQKKSRGLLKLQLLQTTGPTAHPSVDQKPVNTQSKVSILCCLLLGFTFSAM